MKTNQSGDIVQYDGLVFDIIKQLAKDLNFTVKVESLNKWNAEQNTSLLTPSSNASISTNQIPDILLKLVENRTYAFGACAVTIINNFKNYINYTYPISTQSYTLLVARPKELSRALLFILPFTGDVSLKLFKIYKNYLFLSIFQTWLSLAAAIVTLGPILYAIHRYSPVYEYQGIPKTSGLYSVQNCIWYIYGALLQQGELYYLTFSIIE